MALTTYKSVLGNTEGRGSTVLWLAYTLFFLLQPIFQPSLRTWTATGVVLGLFLAVFRVYVSTESELVRRGMIAATFALALLSFPWNAGATTFFIYAAAFVPFAFASTTTVLGLFAVECGGIFLEVWMFRNRPLGMHVDWQNGLFASFMLLVIGGSNVFFAQQRRADLKLRAAQEENIALAALAERERIARDLHDVLGHTLSVIALKAELAKRLLVQNPERAAAEIADVERTARTALAEVREAIGGYRAKGLLAEMEAARHTLEAAGVSLRCDALPETAAILRPNEETVFALALREAVTNIVRHAHATTCTLRFHVEHGQHRLLVEDNGEHGQEPEGNGPPRHA